MLLGTLLAAPLAVFAATTTTTDDSHDLGASGPRVGAFLLLDRSHVSATASPHGYDDLAKVARASARPGEYRSAPRSTLDGLAAAVCSFSATTTVVMADGTRKAISEIEVGDYVLAEDPETGERGPRRVTHVWEHDDTVVDLEIDGDLVTTTEDHPFWNATDREWQEARELDAGDVVRTADGDLVEVGGLRFQTARTTTAFNHAKSVQGASEVRCGFRAFASAFAGRPFGPDPAKIPRTSAQQPPCGSTRRDDAARSRGQGYVGLEVGPNLLPKRATLGGSSESPSEVQPCDRRRSESRRQAR